MSATNTSLARCGAPRFTRHPGSRPKRPAAHALRSAEPPPAPRAWSVASNLLPRSLCHATTLGMAHQREGLCRGMASSAQTCTPLALVRTTAHRPLHIGSPSTTLARACPKSPAVSSWSTLSRSNIIHDCTRADHEPVGSRPIVDTDSSLSGQSRRSGRLLSSHPTGASSRCAERSAVRSARRTSTTPPCVVREVAKVSEPSTCLQPSVALACEDITGSVRVQEVSPSQGVAPVGGLLLWWLRDEFPESPFDGNRDSEPSCSRHAHRACRSVATHAMHTAPPLRQSTSEGRRSSWSGHRMVAVRAPRANVAMTSRPSTTTGDPEPLRGSTVAPSASTWDRSSSMCLP